MFRRSIFTRFAQRCHYDVLGISRSASLAEIKRAFREKAKETHPDVKSSPDASRRMSELVDAYRILRDTGKRKQYDNELSRGIHHGHRQGAGAGPSDGPTAADGSQWGTGFREDPRKSTGRRSQGSAPSSEMENTGDKTASYAAVALVGIVGFLFLRDRADPYRYGDPDPHPVRKPKPAPVIKDAVADHAVEGSSPALQKNLLSSVLGRRSWEAGE
eukprot:TRINITY_DN36731_c0_g1_i2.p1 TRINITY_DN36731_c0_g1~~TRINITY_DN36731_c0_g1_i2.p1  ORF type:complete len:216 (-),score=25.03 TRINITY_DN36731_c0_g1_i2:696-1343(-)